MKLFKSEPSRSDFSVLDKAESAYNTIYVIQNNDQRELWFKGGGDFFLQSRVDVTSPRSLALIYSQMMLVSLLFQPAPRRILMIGLGGGAVSNCLHHCFPRTHIDVVEVDRAVIEISKKYFFLKEAPHYRVHEGDGRMFVKKQRGEEPYDLVLLDAFKSGSVPYHLKTGEFYQEIRSVLSDRGVVASNLYGKSNVQKPADCKTFLSAFGRVYCFEDPERVATVLVATRQTHVLSRGDLERAARSFAVPLPFSMPSLAAMYREEEGAEGVADPFRDDFPEQDFSKAVQENNIGHSPRPRYPIQSFS